MARDPLSCWCGGAGTLTVAETQIEGGSKAVQCRGTGAVQSVRVAYHRSRSGTFWFGIDSKVPGAGGGSNHRGATPQRPLFVALGRRKGGEGEDGGRAGQEEKRQRRCQ